MGRIYVPETKAPDPKDSGTETVDEAVGQGRIYLPSSEPSAEVADDSAPPADDGDGKDGAPDAKPEVVTVTEPAEAKPSPPPAKKATAQRGKAS